MISGNSGSSHNAARMGDSRSATMLSMLVVDRMLHALLAFPRAIRDQRRGAVPESVAAGEDATVLGPAQSSAMGWLSGIIIIVA